MIHDVEFLERRMHDSEGFKYIGLQTSCAGHQLQSTYTYTAQSYNRVAYRSVWHSVRDPPSDVIGLNAEVIQS